MTHSDGLGDKGPVSIGSCWQLSFSLHWAHLSSWRLEGGDMRWRFVSPHGSGPPQQRTSSADEKSAGTVSPNRRWYPRHTPGHRSSFGNQKTSGRPSRRIFVDRASAVELGCLVIMDSDGHSNSRISWCFLIFFWSEILSWKIGKAKVRWCG